MFVIRVCSTETSKIVQEDAILSSVLFDVETDLLPSKEVIHISSLRKLCLELAKQNDVVVGESFYRNDKIKGLSNLVLEKGSLFGG